MKSANLLSFLHLSISFYFLFRTIKTFLILKQLQDIYNLKFYITNRSQFRIN